MSWKKISTALISGMLLCAACQTQSGSLSSVQQAQRPLVYPETARGDVVDVYHGTRVADPYRWLEELDSPQTRSWIEAQNEITFGYLQDIPTRQTINKRLTALWDYERYGMPFKEGGRYFYNKNDGLQNHSVLYVMDSLSGSPRVLLDPNKLSEDGTIAVSGMSISEDGRYIAYALSEGGSDWKDWYIRDIDSGKDLPDVVEWSKFSGASWTHDNKGFFYSRYDKPPEGKKLKEQNYYMKLFYHGIGTQQSKDVLVYERPDHKDWGFGGTVTEDGRYLIISVWKGTERKNLVFYKDLTRTGSAVEELIGEFESQYGFIGNDGPVFWLQTDNDAPRYRVVAIDTRNPAKYNWREVIPQSKDTLRSVSLVGNMFAASYLHDAHSRIQIFDLNGTHVRNVDLPGIGSAGGFGGKREDPETFYSYSSFTDPGTIYRYDMKTGSSDIFRRPKVDFDPDDYVTEQVFYKSKDGTRIPMFITSRKGLQRDGNNPTLLYGYGGFNIPLTPGFRVSRLAWLELGGVYAMANLRGGASTANPGTTPARS